MAGITAFVGLPGSGKSFSAVELAIIPALQEKRKIVTNLPLNLEQITADYFSDDISQVAEYIQIVTAQDFINPQFCEDIAGGSLVVIDECWRVWKSGTKVNKVDDKHMAFIKEHRHRSDDSGRSLDIILVTQNLADIASFLREMVETTVITEKLLALGQDNKFRRVYYQGGIKGFEASATLILKDEFGSYKSEIYKYYKTHMNAAPSIGGALKVDEKRAVGGSTVFSGWKFKAMAGLAVVFIFISIFSGMKSVDNYKDKTKKEQIKPVEQPKSAPIVSEPAPVLATAPPAPPPPPAPKLSEKWRLVGYITHPRESFYLISDNYVTRKISVSKCEKLDFDSVCTINNEIVTAHSGACPSTSSGVYVASVADKLKQQ